MVVGIERKERERFCFFSPSARAGTVFFFFFAVFSPMLRSFNLFCYIKTY